MIPIVGAEVEVTGRTELDGLGPQFACDIDTAFQVAQREVAVGIVDLAAHIQVLRCVGDVHAKGVVILGVGILQDLDLARATSPWQAQVGAIEIGGTGLQGLELTADDILTAAVEHRDIAYHQAQRRVVDDVDRGRTVRHKAIASHRALHAGLAVGGPDKDAAAGCRNIGQLQKKLVELGARHGRCALFLSQAHLQKLLVDLVDQGLVSGNRLGVAGVAFHPTEDLGSVFEQLVAHVGVNQFGQRQVLGGHHVKVVAQGQRKLQALVTLEGRQLFPARNLEVGCGRHRGGVAGALIPAAVQGPNGQARGHSSPGGVGAHLQTWRDLRPTLGVGVVLFFKDDAFVNVATRRELIELARSSFAQGAAHGFNDGAGGHTHGHVFKVERGITVLL